MLNLNNFIIISLLSLSIASLAIIKSVNVFEYRSTNSLIDQENSKFLVLETDFIEMNNKLQYKKSFLEANESSKIDLAMIKPTETYLIIEGYKKWKIY